MSIITLAAARNQLNYDASDIADDAEIQLYVDGITTVVEDYKGEVIEPRTVTEDLELAGENEFWLSRKPVISLTSLVSLDGSTTWDVSTMRARANGQVLVLPGYSLPWGDVVSTYQAGYAVTPERYVRGGLVILQHVWQTQRGAGQGSGGVVDVGEMLDPQTAIPPKAREWLGPHRPGWG